MEKDLKIDIPSDYAEKCTTTKPLKILSFGKQKVIISDDEFSRLETLYKHYVNTFGVEIGFATYFLRMVPEWSL